MAVAQKIQRTQTMDVPVSYERSNWFYEWLNAQESWVGGSVVAILMSIPIFVILFLTGSMSAGIK